MTPDRAKKIAARFFVAASGKLPVREWLLDLDQIDRQAIGKDIQKVEFGWPIGMPYCRPLGRGLWEVRAAFPRAGSRGWSSRFMAARWFCSTALFKRPRKRRSKTSISLSNE